MVLSRLLQKDREKRPQTAAALLEILQTPTVPGLDETVAIPDESPKPSEADVPEVEPTSAPDTVGSDESFEDFFAIERQLAAAEQFKLYKVTERYTRRSAVAVILPFDSPHSEGLAAAGRQMLTAGAFELGGCFSEESTDIVPFFIGSGSTILGAMRSLGSARPEFIVGTVLKLASSLDLAAERWGGGFDFDPGSLYLVGTDGREDPEELSDWSELANFDIRATPSFAAGENDTDSEATLTASAHQAPPISRLAALIYRLVSGTAVKHAAFFTPVAYVMTPALSEEGNALICEALVDPHAYQSATDWVTLLLSKESLPVPEIPAVVSLSDDPEVLARRMAIQEQAREEAEREQRLEAERKLREEAERKAREEAEQKAREEAERRAREEIQRKAREEAERKARQEAEQKAREEAERKARAEAEERAREAAERKEREKAERKAKAEAERESREIAKRKAKEEKERRARESRAKKIREEEERKARQEARQKVADKIPPPQAASAEAPVTPTGEGKGESGARRGRQPIAANLQGTRQPARPRSGQEKAPVSRGPTKAATEKVEPKNAAADTKAAGTKKAVFIAAAAILLLGGGWFVLQTRNGTGWDEIPQTAGATQTFSIRCGTVDISDRQDLFSVVGAGKSGGQWIMLPGESEVSLILEPGLVFEGRETAYSAKPENGRVRLPEIFLDLRFLKNGDDVIEARLLGKSDRELFRAENIKTLREGIPIDRVFEASDSAGWTLADISLEFSKQGRLSKRLRWDQWLGIDQLKLAMAEAALTIEWNDTSGVFHFPCTAVSLRDGDDKELKFAPAGTASTLTLGAGDYFLSLVSDAKPEFAGEIVGPNEPGGKVLGKMAFKISDSDLEGEEGLSIQVPTHLPSIDLNFARGWTDYSQVFLTREASPSKVQAGFEDRQLSVLSGLGHSSIEEIERPVPLDLVGGLRSIRNGSFGSETKLRIPVAPGSYKIEWKGTRLPDARRATSTSLTVEDQNREIAAPLPYGGVFLGELRMPEASDYANLREAGPAEATRKIYAEGEERKGRFWSPAFFNDEFFEAFKRNKNKHFSAFASPVLDLRKGRSSWLCLTESGASYGGGAVRETYFYEISLVGRGANGGDGGLVWASRDDFGPIKQAAVEDFNPSPLAGLRSFDMGEAKHTPFKGRSYLYIELRLSLEGLTVVDLCASKSREEVMSAFAATKYESKWSEWFANFEHDFHISYIDGPPQTLDLATPDEASFFLGNRQGSLGEALFSTLEGSLDESLGDGR
jgi:hypothetical protein